MSRTNKINSAYRNSLIYNTLRAARQHSVCCNLPGRFMVFLKAALENSLLGKLSFAGEQATFLNYSSNSAVFKAVSSVQRKISLSLSGLSRQSGFRAWVDSLAAAAKDNFLMTAGTITMAACLANSALIIISGIKISLPGILMRASLIMLSLVMISSKAREEEVANSSRFIGFLRNLVEN